MENLEIFLNKISTPALILKHQSDGDQWQVVGWNTALIGIQPNAASEFQGKPASELIELQAKAACPLCQGNPVKPRTNLPVHGAMFETVEQKQLRVKVKHDWLDDETLLLWVESFSEDVALTQAHADFVSVVSHEFRTPLTSIKGFADTLLRYGSSLDPEQQKRFVNIIKHQADRLTRMVENLLTVSKLGAQRTQFTYRPVPLRKMVDRIVESVEGKLDSPRTFVIEIPEAFPEVWADPDKMEQVLLNLIDNAAKYSFPNTEVKIAAALDDKADNVDIAISDQGVGIPAEHLPKIFSQFSRIDNPLTRQVEGTGLGLYITKSLTNAMGGDITVRSEDAKGSTFTVHLPVATPERQTAARLGDKEFV